MESVAGLDAVPSAVGLATVLVALLVGAVVQGTLGLGLGLVAAPVVTLVEPDLMPDFLLVLAFLLPMVTHFLTLSNTPVCVERYASTFRQTGCMLSSRSSLPYLVRSPLVSVRVRYPQACLLFPGHSGRDCCR